jgi:glutaredoxin
MPSKLEILDKKINNNNKYAIVFGLSTCGYCKNTINYLKNNNISFKYYTIDEYKNIFFKLLHRLSALKPELEINLKHKTFPVIFIGDKYSGKKFIGGYDKIIKII